MSVSAWLLLHLGADEQGSVGVGRKFAARQMPMFFEMGQLKAGRIQGHLCAVSFSKLKGGRAEGPSHQHGHGDQGADGCQRQTQASPAGCHQLPWTRNCFA